MNDKQRKIIEIISLVVAVIAVAACFYIIKDLRSGTLIVSLQQHFLRAFICIFAIFVLRPFLFFLPTAVQLAFTGIVFPWYLAVLINLIGTGVQMASGYILGQIFGQNLLARLMEKSKIMRAARDKYLKDDFNTIFITHFVPIFPFDNISMLYGANNMNFRKYVFISVLGLAPRVVAYSVAGSSIANPLSVQFIAPLVFVGLFSLLVSVWFRKKEKLNNSQKSAEDFNAEINL